VGRVFEAQRAERSDRGTTGEGNMNEAQWLKGQDPWSMLEFLRGRTSERKFRLFASCCRRLWQLLGPLRWEMVEVAEHNADAPKWRDPQRSFRGRLRALRAEEVAVDDQEDISAGRAVDALRCADGLSAAVDAAYHARALTRVARFCGRLPGGGRGERAAQAALVQEVFGNPFRPVTVEPAWRTADVVALARCIYEERAFERLAVLADALEEAGCTDHTLLDHCRSSAPHVRGCWLVDLLSGKE
jgi:hypothetical protein